MVFLGGPRGRGLTQHFWECGDGYAVLGGVLGATPGAVVDGLVARLPVVV